MTPEKRKAVIDAFSKLLDAIPKGKRMAMFAEMCEVENSLRRGMAGLHLLDGIRKYFLDTPDLGGEDSPFVKQIDKLIPRE